MRSTDPAELTRIHQTSWDERGARIGTRFTVAPCQYTADTLAALAAAGQDVGYLPAELATQAARYQLGEIFPLMGSYAVLPDNPVTNDANPSGWFDYVAGDEVTYRGLDEDQLLARLAEDGRALVTLNQYIVASQDQHDATGHYLDETVHWNRIGSRFDGRLVAALIDGADHVEGFPEDPVDGSLRCAHDVHRDFSSPRSGARTTSAAAGHRDLVAEPAGHTATPPPEAAERFYPTSFDLDHEWQRIVAEYLRVGIAAELGMTDDEYRASLPPFAPQPTDYVGRFDVPLLVETRVPWERFAELAGYQTSIIRRGFVFSPADERSAMPAQPYTAWVNMWGRRFVDPIAPAQARAELDADEVGGNVLEVLVTELVRPELSRNARYFEAVGYVSRVETLGSDDYTFAKIDRTPMINRTRRDEAQVSSNLNPIAYSTFRPLARLGDRDAMTREPLQLPFVFVRQEAAESSRGELALPPGDHYEHVRLVHGEGAATRGESRRLLFVVDGSLGVGDASLGRGEVVFVDSGDDAIAASDDALVLELTVSDAWQPGGAPAPPSTRTDHDAPPKLRHMYVRDEQAHFRVLEPAGQEWSVATAVFLCLPAGTFGDWHTEAHTTLACVISGELEVGVGGDGGSIEVFRPGDLMLLEDHHGQGHTTRTRVDTAFAAIILGA